VALAMPLAVNACNALSGIDDFTVRTGAEAGMEGSGQAESGGSSGGVGPGDAPAQGDNTTGTGDAPAGDSANDGAMATVDARADAASDAEGGTTGSCDGGFVAHTNGLGQMFYDCAPLNTLNQTQAFEACAAFSGNAGACMFNPGFSCMGDVVCSKGSSTCACWVYDGNRPGRVCSSTPDGGCCCPGASSPPAWN
jgi:hypothetical protein